MNDVESICRNLFFRKQHKYILLYIKESTFSKKKLYVQPTRALNMIVNNSTFKR